jgi:ComF family protein
VNAPAALRAQLTAAADAIVAVLLAPSCAGCGLPLDHPTQGAVCAGCWRSIPPIAPPVCDTCGDPLPAWREISWPSATCARCRRTRPLISRSRAAGAYDSTLGAVVRAFKYDGRRSIAVGLGAMMRDRGGAVLLGADAAVPVPLHPSRRRARGFNQADDLARHLGLPVVRALRRVRATATQADLPAARRHANVRSAFANRPAAAALRGTIVVLVDDVSTTGATLESCARVLQDAGVRDIRALTAARAVTCRSSTLL